MRSRFRPSPAMVVACIALLVALGGTTYAASGGNFILGKANTASSTTSLTAPVAGKGLQVTNTSTGAGATALGLNVAKGHPPFITSSGTKVTNLNADKLDSLDSTSFVTTSDLRQVGPITVTAPDGGSQHPTILSVGHFVGAGLAGLTAHLPRGMP